MSLILNDPAYPTIEQDLSSWTTVAGFTKLELGALMIAQGLVAKYNLKAPEDQGIIAQLSVQLATEVLFEAQKIVI